MTQEEKAKRYDEALKIAKKQFEYPAMSSCYGLLEELFPELKESEDERIRKELIRVFSNREKYVINQSFGDINVSDILAWLEKQGEKMSDPRYSILAKLIEADDIYQMSVNASMVKEAKNKAIEALSNLEISKLFGLENQAEQNPAEWSEEDKKILKEVISNYESACLPPVLERERILKELKSLNPQNRWKPSDEMLEALYRVIPENVMEKTEDKILLDKLYQGLKYGRVLSKE